MKEWDFGVLEAWCAGIVGDNWGAGIMGCRGETVGCWDIGTLKCGDRGTRGTAEHGDAETGENGDSGTWGHWDGGMWGC